MSAPDFRRDPVYRLLFEAGGPLSRYADDPYVEYALERAVSRGVRRRSFVRFAFAVGSMSLASVFAFPKAQLFGFSLLAWVNLLNVFTLYAFVQRKRGKTSLIGEVYFNLLLETEPASLSSALRDIKSERAIDWQLLPTGGARAAACVAVEGLRTNIANRTMDVITYSLLLIGLSAGAGYFHAKALHGAHWGLVIVLQSLMGLVALFLCMTGLRLQLVRSHMVAGPVLAMAKLNLKAESRELQRTGRNTSVSAPIVFLAALLLIAMMGAGPFTVLGLERLLEGGSDNGAIPLIAGVAMAAAAMTFFRVVAKAGEEALLVGFGGTAACIERTWPAILERMATEGSAP